MRLVHAIMAGLAAGLLLCAMASLMNAGLAFCFFLSGWALCALLFYRHAGTLKEIWALACLVASVECFTIPLASLVLPIFNGQPAVQVTGREASGQFFFHMLGSQLFSFLSGYVGLFIGFILLAFAYLSLKPARRR